MRYWNANFRRIIPFPTARARARASVSVSFCVRLSTIYNICLSFFAKTHLCDTWNSVLGGDGHVETHRERRRRRILLEQGVRTLVRHGYPRFVRLALRIISLGFDWLEGCVRVHVWVGIRDTRVYALWSPLNPSRNLCRWGEYLAIDGSSTVSRAIIDQRRATWPYNA